MRKKIFLVFISVVFFLLFISIPIPPKTPSIEKSINIEISACVLEDDVFQLFYMQDDMMIFSEKKSVRNPIKGSPNFQKIEFILPIEKPLKKIRIDIGQNINQKPIVLKSVKFIFSERYLRYDILESFIPNSYINYENGKYITKIVHGLAIPYDPYFIAEIDFDKLLQQVTVKQALVSNSFVYLIGFFLSIVVFVILYKSNITIQGINHSVYIFLFLLILITPSVVKLFDIEKKSKVNEKRELAPKPEFRIDKKFSSEFEKYYNDNFALRSELINWVSRIKVGIFKVSSRPKVVQFGKDGYLFFNIVNCYSNANKYTDKQVEKIYKKQLKLKNDFAKQGIKYIVGFWPNKHTIYSENYPISMKMQVRNDISLSNQIVSYFNKKGLSFFDVTKELLDAKRNGQLYYKFDTHWNNNGAYEAYKSFCKQTYSELGLIPVPINEFNITHRKVNRGDLTNMLGLDSISNYSDDAPFFVLKDKNKEYKIVNSDGLPRQTVVTLNENCNNKDVVLVFRDSYFSALSQFLSLHYSKVVYIWSYPSESHPVDNESVILKVKPDVIINSCVERYLPDLLQ